MMEKQARSKWFSTLISVLNIVAITTLYLKCEDISLGWLVVLMLLWMGAILVMGHRVKKKFTAKLVEPIAAIVAELRGGIIAGKSHF